MIRHVKNHGQLPVDGKGGRDGKVSLGRGKFRCRAADADVLVCVATHSLVMPVLTGMSSSWTFLGGADASICVMARASLVRGAVRARARR